MVLTHKGQTYLGTYSGEAVWIYHHQDEEPILWLADYLDRGVINLDEFSFWYRKIVSGEPLEFVGGFPGRKGRSRANG